MTRSIHGILHGKTIELDEDLGLSDGEEVNVIVKPVNPRVWGEGIRRSAGAAADVPGFDDAFEQLAREREAATFRNEPS